MTPELHGSGLVSGNGAGAHAPHGHPGSRRQPLVPSEIVAVVMFLAAEAMFFAGMISAFIIGRAAAGPVAWPPLDQPRLPVAVTGVNTCVLLASGVSLLVAQRARRGPMRFRLTVVAALLGAVFVAVQGYEWTRLVGFGLTLTSSTYGSYFYLIVGVHALHAVAALVALAWALRRLSTGRLRAPAFSAVSLVWYFVVGVWPVLYALVYLS
jgi:heme/copper-type cytochrome/quinol oxidase subunit 3